MFRRVIAILLIFQLLAGQIASLPLHAHPGMSLEERLAHDALPHFHFGSHCHCHRPAGNLKPNSSPSSHECAHHSGDQPGGCDQGPHHGQCNHCHDRDQHHVHDHDLVHDHDHLQKHEHDQQQRHEHDQQQRKRERGIAGSDADESGGSIVSALDDSIVSALECSQPSPLDDHDSDAIYLVGLGTPWIGQGGTPTVRIAVFDSAWPGFPVCLLLSQRLRDEREFERPPDKVLDGSAIYLTNRHLLI